MIFRKSVAVAPPSVLSSTVPPLPSARVAVMEPEVAAPAIAAVALAEPPAPVPIPDASVEPVAEIADALRRQYLTLSAELGLHQPGLLRDEARAFFAARGTRLYDHAKVKAYLDDQYGKEGVVIDPRFVGVVGEPMTRGEPTWGWRPLRAKDVRPTENNTFGWGTPTSNDALWPTARQYSKPVPLPVLLTVKEVLAQFPGAHCYISDQIQTYEHRAPVLDPFLLVTIEGERFIIERWDEPAYRE
jgi:hypothetical protein